MQIILKMKLQLNYIKYKYLFYFNSKAPSISIIFDIRANFRRFFMHICNFIKYKFIFIILFFFLFNIISPFSYSFSFSDDSLYVWSNSSENIPTSSINTKNFSNEEENTQNNTVSQDNKSTENSVNSSGNFLGLTSGSAVLMDQRSGFVLYEHNSHEQLRPASVTKIMALLLIMESLDNRINKP